MSGRCNTGMHADMLELTNKAKQYTREKDFNLGLLNEINNIAEDIKNKNGEVGCKLF